MPKKPKTRKAVYRDKKTGRFASKATWKRSRARGGTRFVRESTKEIKTSRTRKRVPRPAIRPKKHEYQVNVKYSPNPRNDVHVQISAIGPANATREEVIAAIDYYIEPETDGNNLPEWKVQINFWEKYGKQSVHDDEQARNNLRRFFFDADVEVTNKTKGIVL